MNINDINELNKIKNTIEEIKNLLGNYNFNVQPDIDTYKQEILVFLKNTGLDFAGQYDENGNLGLR